MFQVLGPNKKGYPSSLGERKFAGEAVSIRKNDENFRCISFKHFVYLKTKFFNDNLADHVWPEPEQLYSDLYCTLARMAVDQDVQPIIEELKLEVETVKETISDEQNRQPDNDLKTLFSQPKRLDEFYKMLTILKNHRDYKNKFKTPEAKYTLFEAFAIFQARVGMRINTETRPSLYTRLIKLLMQSRHRKQLALAFAELVKYPNLLSDNAEQLNQNAQGTAPATVVTLAKKLRTEHEQEQEPKTQRKQITQTNLLLWLHKQTGKTDHTPTEPELPTSTEVPQPVHC